MQRFTRAKPPGAAVAPPPVHWPGPPRAPSSPFPVQPAKAPLAAAVRTAPPPTRYGAAPAASAPRAPARTAPPPHVFPPPAPFRARRAAAAAPIAKGQSLQGHFFFAGSSIFGGGTGGSSPPGIGGAAPAPTPAAPKLTVDTKAEAAHSDDDALSQYSPHSPSSPARRFKEAGGRSKKVFAAYTDHKHDAMPPINTSAGLAAVVKTFDTGKNSNANTHVLFRAESDPKYSLVSIGTATAIRLYADRFEFDTKDNVQKVHGKSAHVHTEMHLLWTLTGGDAQKIPGILTGHKLVVDKAVCADCYPFVLDAKPADVRDGTNFFAQGAGTRQSWDDWKNPFGK
ncbi:MAG TPA: hypothetical protein VN668_17580 [Stellaceae bacterium]|nr:hypothetical protein [Stellaceae bacterium]